MTVAAIRQINPLTNQFFYFINLGNTGPILSKIIYFLLSDSEIYLHLPETRDIFSSETISAPANDFDGNKQTLQF